MDSIDLEHQSFRSILKQDHYLSDETEKNILSNLFILFKIFIILLIVAPFTFCDLYFAYNDNSCTKLTAGKLLVNLYDILKIDGIIHVIMFIIMSFLLFISSTKIIPIVIFKFMSIFDIAWSILGSVIFWGLINNNLCDISIYNYLYAKFIVVFVTRLLFIFY